MLFFQELYLSNKHTWIFQEPLFAHQTDNNFPEENYYFVLNSHQTQAIFPGGRSVCSSNRCYFSRRLCLLVKHMILFQTALILLHQTKRQYPRRTDISAIDLAGCIFIFRFDFSMPFWKNLIKQQNEKSKGKIFMEIVFYRESIVALVLVYWKIIKLISKRITYN